MFSIKVNIFIVTTMIIAYISRKSLTNFHSHGFFRFIAWEFIIILFLLNFEYWFYEPFSSTQIISWVLLVSSTFFVVAGHHLIHSRGNPDALRPGKELYKIEKTTKLVTEGIYHYIRHPLYGSLLLLAWGIFFKSVSIIGFILVIGSSLSLVLTAKSEEKENCKYFGSEYELYMQRAKMFIPYVW